MKNPKPAEQKISRKQVFCNGTLNDFGESQHDLPGKYRMLTRLYTCRHALLLQFNLSTCSRPSA